ncbi:MAG: hypothetical protein AAFU53_20235 [Cyanobacteria bacterium J06632_3]
MTAFNSSDVTKSFWVSLPFNAHRLSYLPLIQKLSALPSVHFTEIDQAFIVWGAITLAIFSLGQFSPLSWTIQAVLDAALTGAGIATTSGLTWAIAVQAKLRWVIFLWAGLMAAGTVVTAYGVFFSSVLILSNLCLLWLGLCAVGYGAMAVGMRSRCFTAACLVHFAAMLFLNCTLGCQFFSSGLIMASTLFFFSFVQWDMQSS